MLKVSRQQVTKRFKRLEVPTLRSYGGTQARLASAELHRGQIHILLYILPRTFRSLHYDSTRSTSLPMNSWDHSTFPLYVRRATRIQTPILIPVIIRIPIW